MKLASTSRPVNPWWTYDTTPEWTRKHPHIICTVKLGDLEDAANNKSNSGERSHGIGESDK
jgi:hypothetical protein